MQFVDQEAKQEAPVRPRRAPAKRRLRNFVFTLNNYTEAERDNVIAWLESSTKYAIVGREEGKGGTPHLQGYAELHAQTTFKKVKDNLGGRVHLEPRKGTAQQASDYCAKEDPNPWICGTISKAGKRTDIEGLVADCKSGMSAVDLYEKHPVAMFRYYRHAHHCRETFRMADRETWGVDVFVFWGDAGSGKTREAFAKDPGLYMVSLTARGGSVWFDGYDGEEAILIDDFYGGAIHYPMLLRLLDRYRFKLPVKGSSTWKSWKRVYITSNKHPREWYPDGLTNALARRIKETVHFLKPFKKN